MRSCRPLFLLFIWGFVAFAHAYAQPVAASPQAEPVVAEPAASEQALAAPLDPAAVDPAAVEQAKQHFAQAVAFAQAGDCGAAIVEFEAAYQLVPRPNALYNIAQCQERLFRYDLAIRYYERYLQEAPADAPDRAAVSGALATLRNLLGTVAVHCNVPAEVWVDDRLAGQAPGDVLMPSGGHTLELRAKGYIPARGEVRLVGRQRIELTLELEKARTTVRVTETTGLDPTLFGVGVGVTVVTAAIGLGFAVHVGALHDDALALPAQHPDRSKKREQIESAELTADVFFASAALLAVGTTIVAFVTDWDGAERPPAGPASARLQLSPMIGRSQLGLSLAGDL